MAIPHGDVGVGGRTRFGTVRGSFALVCALVFAIATLSSSVGGAAVITVAGACNLNAAIAAANNDAPSGGCPAGFGADTIELTGNVSLEVVDNDTNGPNGLPSVVSQIVLEGNGHVVTRNPSQPAFRILHVALGGDLTVRNLTLGYGVQSGSPAEGGCLYIRGQLTLENVTVAICGAFSDANASGGALFVDPTGQVVLDRSRIRQAFVIAEGLGLGGAIFATGSLTVLRSSITDSYSEAGTPYGGGIYGAAGFLTVDESTLSNLGARSPMAAQQGAAIYAGRPDGSEALAVITNSTISGNIARCPDEYLACLPYGATVYNAAVFHTTFSGNLSDPTFYSGTTEGSIYHDSYGDHCTNVVDLGGGNLADDTTCVPTIAGTLTGLDPNLKDNGGLTETHALMAGSTAIDIAGSCGLANDQRGVDRETACDAGAFEWKGCTPTVIRDLEITGFASATNCHTIWLGPNLTVADTGFASYAAGARFVLRSGVTVESGGELILGINPGLLP